MSLFPIFGGSSQRGPFFSARNNSGVCIRRAFVCASGFSLLPDLMATVEPKLSEKLLFRHQSFKLQCIAFLDKI